ncbi:hypothetical protein B0O80DRAFT_494477 [Mortierella sp. GBAus27b]|nr:hypothetical protein BGX31_000089 [Mortierella sp. GBA43]KAI8360296.1 hypothetical protein B0O80DRAFT_494477 [Mortierella sp. GBAus27b]
MAYRRSTLPLSLALVATLVLQCAYPVPIQAVPATSFSAPLRQSPSVNYIAPSDVSTESVDENATLSSPFDAAVAPESAAWSGSAGIIRPVTGPIGRMCTPSQLAQILRNEGLGTGALSPYSSMIYPASPINLSQLQQQAVQLRRLQYQQQNLGTEPHKTYIATGAIQAQPQKPNPKPLMEAQPTNPDPTQHKRHIEAVATSPTGVGAVASSTTTTTGPPRGLPPLYPGSNGLLCYFDGSDKALLHCSDGTSYRAIQDIEADSQLNDTEATEQQEQQQAVLRRRSTPSSSCPTSALDPHGLHQKRSSGIGSVGGMNFGSSSPSLGSFGGSNFNPFGAGSTGSGLSSWSYPSAPSSPLTPPSFGSFGSPGSQGTGWPSSSLPPSSFSLPSFGGGGGGGGSDLFDWMKQGSNLNGSFDTVYKRNDPEGCDNLRDEGDSSKYRDYGVNGDSYYECDGDNDAGDQDRDVPGCDHHMDKRQLGGGLGPMGLAGPGSGRGPIPGLGPAGFGSNVIPVPIEINTLVYPDGKTSLLPPNVPFK